MKKISDLTPQELADFDLGTASIPDLLHLPQAIDTALSILCWTPGKKEKKLSPEEKKLQTELNEKKSAIRQQLDELLSR
jgi:hypothetical protein